MPAFSVPVPTTWWLFQATSDGLHRALPAPWRHDRCRLHCAAGAPPRDPDPSGSQPVNPPALPARSTAKAPIDPAAQTAPARGGFAQRDNVRAIGDARRRQAVRATLDAAGRRGARHDLQDRVDAVLGTGRFHVMQMQGSPALWLVPGERAPCQMPGNTTLRLLLHGLSPGMAQWVHVQVLLGCGFRRRGTPLQRVYEQTLTLAAQGEAEAELMQADWQALQLRVQHAWLQRMEPAVRIIGRYRLRAKVAALCCRHAPAVRIAWLHVLRAWADDVTDAAALPRHADAEAVCEALIQAPETRALGQQRLAGCLLQRAALAQGAHQHALLLRADAAAEASLAHASSPEAALVSACIALVRAERAAPALAATLRGEAAHQLTLAATELALAVRVQQARRAIALADAAEDARPSGCAVGDLAQHPADRQRTCCDLGTQTWLRTVEARHRHGQHAQACMAAAQAMQQGRLQSALVAVWERASAAWGAQPLEARTRRHWQDNARACLVAGLQCRLHRADG